MLHVTTAGVRTTYTSAAVGAFQSANGLAALCAGGNGGHAESKGENQLHYEKDSLKTFVKLLTDEESGREIGLDLFVPVLIKMGISMLFYCVNL